MGIEIGKLLQMNELRREKKRVLLRRGFLSGRSQDLSMLNGSLQVVTPLTPGLNLVYQSDTQSNAIVTVETSLLSTVPTAISAQLTFNGTAGTNYGYSTTGLTAGRSLRFAQEANTSALATGRYNWQMDVTTTTGGVPTVHSFTGSTNVVNRNSSTAPFGRGWQLAGLDQLVSQTGGMLFVRSDGTTLWFADNGSGGYLHAEGDDTYSTLIKNANLTYTLTDTHGDQANFSAAGLLTSHVDANANTTRYVHQRPPDADHRPVWPQHDADLHQRPTHVGQ